MRDKPGSYTEFQLCGMPLEPFEKTVLQLALVLKGIDVAQSLSRISLVGATCQFDGEVKANRCGHTWKDLRLCSHDLRPLFLKGDSFHRATFSGLLGPLGKENRSLLNWAIAELERWSPLESVKGQLQTESIDYQKILESGIVATEERRGYEHTSRTLATAMLYGQWSHSTRATDLFTMSNTPIGTGHIFCAVTDFVVHAGNAFLVALLAFAYETREEKATNIGPGPAIDVVAVRKELRALIVTLKRRLKNLNNGRPPLVHVWPF